MHYNKCSQYKPENTQQNMLLFQRQHKIKMTYTTGHQGRLELRLIIEYNIIQNNFWLDTTYCHALLCKVG